MVEKQIQLYNDSQKDGDDNNDAFRKLQDTMMLSSHHKLEVSDDEIDVFAESTKN